jgi:thiol:disulfide interchange protein DsbG
MMRFLHILLFGVLIFSASAAIAQDKKSPPVPPALKTLSGTGAQVAYMGTRNGMDGWIAVKGGQPQFFYFSPDGEVFVTGLMFSGEGKSLTMEDVHNFMQSPKGKELDAFVSGQNPPSPTDVAAQTQPTSATAGAKIAPITEMKAVSSSEKLYIDVERANWVQIGKKDAPLIYMFVDPQCPYCKAFMKDLRQKYIEAGLIQVRIVPVGLSDERMAQAAFLLASPNPQELWFKHLDGDESALPVKNDINDQGVQRNLAIMQNWKLDVTPLTLYRGKDGKIKIVQGRGKDIPAMIADIAR